MIEIPVSYLLTISRTALKDMHLSRLAISANRRKELRGVIEDWIEARAQALLIEWLIEHGEELVAAAIDGMAPKVEEEKIEPKTDVTKPFRYEFWKSERRHARRKAG